MRVEKQDSSGEGGRGFRHLFDWDAKSRNKFLSRSPDLLEQPNQTRNVDTNTPTSQYHPAIEDYMASSLIVKGCASSLIDEDDYGKSPGVVARLMGLDSLPASNLSSNRFFDTKSMQDSSTLYVRKSPKLEQKDHHQMEQKHKMIKKFQTESLPPKSARSVPITQHKLLSPIRCSGFVSSNDPARIMEAATKIPLARSSSVDTSARKTCTRRQVESNAARSLKGQSMTKSWDGCLDGKKSVSLAIQAKVNVKKREGMSMYGDELINGQPNRQKNTLKKPLTNSVLKQNNQKQNSLTDRRKSAAKPSVSSLNSQSRKPVSEKSPSVIAMNKTMNQRKRFTEDVNNRVRDKNDRNGKNVVKSNGLDVVSFTFTSPISRSTEKDNQNGLNPATGGDSLSTLLDKKLRVLTSMSSSSISRESRINRILVFEDDRNRDRISKDDICSKFSSNGAQAVAEELAAVFSKKSTTMDVEHGYVKDILSDIESMFEDFTLKRTSKIVNPRLFDQLEAKRPVFEKIKELKLRRKLLFDCVSECVDSRCRVWARGVTVVRRKDRLVEQVCNKITGWEEMKDCMVDELVDKDMSSGQHKKWLDFDFEAFELGVEIERRLLGCLIDEAVVDILVP